MLGYTKIYSTIPLFQVASNVFTIEIMLQPPCTHDNIAYGFFILTEVLLLNMADSIVVSTYSTSPPSPQKGTTQH